MEEITREYIKENTFEGGGVQKGSFFLSKPSQFVERIDNAKDIDDARRIAEETYIPKIKRYNHAYTIAFSVESDSRDEDVTAAEMIAGLERRIEDIRKTGEIKEACGASYDTFENDGWVSPHLPALEPGSLFRCNGHDFQVVAGDYERMNVVSCTLCSMNSSISETRPSCRAAFAIAGKCQANERDDGIPVHFEKVKKSIH